MKTESGIGLGSNLGDRLANLREALRRLEALPGVRLLGKSSVYETEPVGVPEEYANLTFYNTVLIIGTSLDAHKLFAQLQKIETALGRKRPLRQNTPRTIDIDLIYYDGQTIRSGGLVIPHPRWTKRRFVLQPLADVRGYLILPGHDRRVRDILAALPPGQQIRQLLAEW